MSWNPLNTSIGLALGGGAAKGIAHIGVLKAFEDEDVQVSCVTGTSIGALVAAYYAFGKSSDEILAVAKELRFTQMTSLNWRGNGGLFTTKAFKDMIYRDLGRVNIEDAHIPLAICTTDIVSGERVAFEKGDLATAVCASVAVPGVFAPVEYQGRKLVDGGIVENVPVSLLDDLGAGIKVAVDLNGVSHYQDPDGMLDIIGNAIDICMDMKTRDQLKQADIIISLDLADYSRSDNSDKIYDLMSEGYRPMKSKLRRLLWFKKTNYLRYFVKLILEVSPIKFPHFIKQWFDPKLSEVKIK